MGLLRGIAERPRVLARATRPVARETEVALARRWAELPHHARTPAQLLGRRTAGCEGTHGVFPRCNLACSPCYHAREANRVRTDGAHTLAELERQMAYLRSVRGAGQHAQLIGGEVSLLEPDDHAAALAVMRRHGPKPMSMTNGDFDYELVRPAWEALEHGETAADPAVRAAQERLQACSYAMAHPEQGRLVPACVQHAILDAAENVRLRRLLPIGAPRA
jgi:hypothetical protein